MNLIRANALAKKLGGVHRTTVIRRAKSDSTFPKPVRLSRRWCGWVESEVDEWLKQFKQGETDES